jgi:FkbM family methyltransferase
VVKNILKLTRVRIRIANILYKLIKIFYPDNQIIAVRENIKYSLNLSEGIDLSIFLFGNFQNYITKLENYNLPQNIVVFDIGANIGSVTLKLASTYKNSMIYAFEPTNYAYEKLLTNIALNPFLRERIKPQKLYLSNQPEDKKNFKIYSSWKVDDLKRDTHPIHGGIKQEAAQIETTTVDIFVMENHINQIDFIKIDTDGHELAILKGGEKSINKFRPIIIFEIGQYLLNENAIKFEEYYSFFVKNNYELFDLKQRNTITLSNFKKRIPDFSTIDLVAIPFEKKSAKAK